jgi:hypothetical protein
MGIEFEQLGLQTLGLLRRLIGDALDRFRLAPGAPTSAGADAELPV